MTETDIVRIASTMGYKAGFCRQHKHSHLAKTLASVSVHVWYGQGKERMRCYIGQMTTLALLSEEALCQRIENKVSKVEVRS